MTYFSGIVDEHDRIRLGGYPGALRETLGVVVEEFHPLPADGAVALTSFDAGTIWSELAEVIDAEVVASYASGSAVGSPAVTRRQVGSGTAWYVGTELSDSGIAQLGSRLFDEAGVEPTVRGVPAGVEAVRRVGESGSFLFVINHTDAPVKVPVSGVDLLTGQAGRDVPARGVAVLREDA